MIHRLGMGENPQDMISNGPSERDDAPALSIDDMSELKPGRATGSMDSMTGTTIGYYLVGERLGGGAMAAVYRAHDQSTGEEVAIKVVLPSADSVMQARFRREARLVSTLIHPHIVRTLQVGSSGGVVYIAMKLIEGTTLAEVLDRHGTLSVADAARILAPIAEALAHAHEKRIVHRDVKPSNILLQRAELGDTHSVTVAVLPYPVIPLLSDFGIARALDSSELTNAGRTIGTPAFMAPEQCAGSAEIDGRADVYALGAVLYRCLVGRAPFSGSTTQILHAHVYEPLFIPDAVADTLPSTVLRVLARAMMKDPAQRFERVEMMAAELREVATLPVARAQDGGAVVDSTMTMASLPAAKSPTTSTSRVLVPAASSVTTIAAPRPGPVKPVLRPSVPLTTPVRATAVASARGRAQSRRSRRGMIALVSAFAFLVVLAVGMLVNSVWPGVGADDPVVADATATPAAVAAAGTPQLPGDETSGTPERPAAALDAAEDDPPSRATPEGTPDGPMPTPRPPILVLSPTWELGLASYEEGIWHEAVDHLGLVKRTMDGWDLTDEDEIDAQRLTDMLVTSYMGVATDAAKNGDWDGAVVTMEKAAALAPRVTMLADMVANLESLAKLKGETDAASQASRVTLRTDFADLQAAYASRLAREERVCDAVHHLGYAISIAASQVLRDQHDEMMVLCRDQNAEEAIVEIGGTILYSSVDGGTYNIYRMPINAGAGTALPSAVVVPNAALPRLSPNGDVLAYYNRQEGDRGLFGVRVNGLSPVGGGERYSPHQEDSRDSPPSWNSSGSSLAYATAFDDQASRIWITPANTDTSTQDMNYGKDPAWRPGSDLIVFNGPDTSGQNVGLYWMTSGANGADRSALTSNGNDQRPVWTSDGKYLVFMSQDRYGIPGWEIYRMTWPSGEIVLLSDGHDAQDGLPAISPDNRWVAFMSDRGGRWNLWYVSIDGGEVHFLSSIAGQPLSWLEHSVQWVP